MDLCVERNEKETENCIKSSSFCFPSERRVAHTPNQYSFVTSYMHQYSMDEPG
jgi:hypothetical protein